MTCQKNKNKNKNTESKLMNQKWLNFCLRGLKKCG